MATLYTPEEEEELGALIYSFSLTAKRFQTEENQKKAPTKDTPAIDEDNNAPRPKGVAPRKRGKRQQYVCGHPGGCNRYVQSGGRCWRHGAKAAREQCAHRGCTNYAVKSSFCVRHGATAPRSKCGRDGCRRLALEQGFCSRHGKRCGHAGCRRKAVKSGVCMQHVTANVSHREEAVGETLGHYTIGIRQGRAKKAHR